MGFSTHLFGVLVLPLLAVSTEGWEQVPVGQTQVACAVTSPNGIVASNDERDPRSHGNALISVWPEGTVIFRPGGAGFITRDGALGMKFGWRRGAAGQLRIEGRRLDAPAPPLRAEVPNGYGDSGFQATYVIFPTIGCWEVTGRVADASVTFVTRVVKIANGPDWHRNVP